MTLNEVNCTPKELLRSPVINSSRWQPFWQ